MNILIGKTGTTRFSGVGAASALYGGCDTEAVFFTALAKQFPEHTFYFCAPSDLNKVELPAPNIIDLFHKINDEVPRGNYRGGKTPIADYKLTYKWLEDNGIKFDKALIFYSAALPFAEYNEGYYAQRKNAERIVRMSDIRVSLICCIAKHFEIPTYFIINDIRQFGHLPADMHVEAIYGPMNGTDESPALVNGSKTEYTTMQTPIIYKEVEKNWLLSRPAPKDWRNVEKTNKFINVLNPLTGRAKYLHEWLGPSHVYGNWNAVPMWKADLEKYGHTCDAVGITEMEDLMYSTKFSLVVPPKAGNVISSQMLTCKVVALLYYGILPFFCSTDYDTQKIYNDRGFRFLRIDTPDDLKIRMAMLDSNDIFYRDIANTLYKWISNPRYYNGEMVKENYSDLFE